MSWSFVTTCAYFVGVAACSPPPSRESLVRRCWCRSSRRRCTQARRSCASSPRAGLSPFETVNGQSATNADFIATEIEVLKGEPVQDLVREELGSAPPISVNPIGTTAVVQVVVESTDPKVAAATANAYVAAYITHRRQQGVADSLAAQNEVQSKIDDLQDQIDALNGPDAQLPANQAQRQALVQQQALFKNTLSEQQVNSALITGGAEIVRRATVPTSPIKPTPLRNAVLALLVGAMLGAALCFLVDHLDDSIGSPEELERLPGGVRVIGEIPIVEGWKSKDRTHVVAAAAPRSAPAEAYRALRTAIDFISLDHPMRTIQITSPNPSEGKTTTLANLAVTLATAGKRVVVVCCDLRRPRIHEFFGLLNNVGFTSALLGERPVSAVLQAVPGIPRLRILASGPLPPNPSELLGSQRTADVFAALAADCDIVLIDSPPLLPVTDAQVLFRQVDATLLVVSAGSTTRKEATAALAKIRQVDGPLVGSVLNGVKAEGGYGYAYRYERGDEPRPDGSANGFATNGSGALEPQSPRTRPQRSGGGRRAARRSRPWMSAGWSGRGPGGAASSRLRRVPTPGRDFWLR